MKTDSRVFLLRKGELRPLWWFMKAPDHSIYFGSSNAKHFRRGRTGTVRTSEVAGVPLDLDSGRAMAPTEFGGKLSVHGSGVVNLETRTAGVRDRYIIAAPRSGFAALPLVLVIPMQPDLYPTTGKIARSSDLVISADVDDAPFAILFYLIAVGAREPAAITSIRERAVGGTVLARTFGAHELTAFVYHPRGYRVWLREEGNMVSLPQAEGAQATWPFLD